MEGYIKLHREIMDKAIWKCSTPGQKAVLVALLLMAGHKEKQWEWKGQKYICQPGEFITSSTALAEAAGVGRQVVRDALERFKKYEFLTYETTKISTKVKISNWAAYQGSKEHDPTKFPTIKQPSENQARTTTKNEKNGRINNKSRTKTSVPEDFRITERLERWATENDFHSSQMEHQVPFFIEKHKALGSKYTDWEAAFQTWMRNARDWGKLPPKPEESKHEIEWARLLRYPFVRCKMTGEKYPTKDLKPIMGRPSERMYRHEALGYTLLEGVEA